MLLENTTGLIFGVSSRRSIAWAIAQSLAGAGARLAFTYRERVGHNVKALATSLPGSLTMKYDVNSDDEIQGVIDRVDREFDGLDTLVHSVAFAPKEALDKPYLHTTRQAFQTALGVSAYSLIAMARSALPLDAKTRWRKHHHADLPGKRARLSKLQRDGCGQGRPRSQRAISGPQSWST